MEGHILLIQSMLLTKPASVTIDMDFGPLDVITEKDEIVHGNHVAILGPKEDILKWFKDEGSVWLGCGSPLVKEFKYFNFKKNTQ